MVIKCPGGMLVNMDNVVSVEAKDKIVEIDTGRQLILMPFETPEEADIAVQTIYETRTSHLDLTKINGRECYGSVLEGYVPERERGSG